MIEALAIAFLCAITFFIAWLATGDAEAARLITLQVGGTLVCLSAALFLWSWLTNDW